MDYKELADRLEKRYKGNETGSTFVTLCSRSDVLNAATAITELFSRAEEAEAERDEARQDCAIAERNHMIEVERRQAAEARAEKAERERDAAVEMLKKANDETGNCYGCKYFYAKKQVCTDKEKKIVCDCGENNMWEWRGPQKEE